MRTVSRSLAAVCLCALGAACPAVAEDGYNQSQEILEFFGNFRDRYEGVITAVEKVAGGEGRVRIRATTEYIYENASGWDREERKVSKECVLRWTRHDQPVPFLVDMRVSFMARDDGDVTAVMLGETFLPYYRTNSAGLIEVLLLKEMPSGRKVWLRAQPDRINLMPYATVAWSREYGLVISTFEAGGSDTEEESQREVAKGLPVANVPGERIQIGRDGWKKTPPEFYGDDSKRVVPPKQYIGTAG